MRNDIAVYSYDETYFITADQLGSFTLNYYGTIFRNNSGWWAGVATFDNGSDNQAANDGNADMFLQDQWKVPTSGGLGMNNIRNVNKFINETEAKYKEQKITGADAMIKHYLAEAYVIRAMLYFEKLQTYGDFPILLKELNINDSLAEASRRMPRNEVARQIISDLNQAIPNLQETLSDKLRITQNAALALKSRVALYEGTFEKYHRGTGRVPGDANWPGKDKAWNKGKTFNQQAEVDYFLGEAMAAAKAVSDKVGIKTTNSVSSTTTTLPCIWDRRSRMSVARYWCVSRKPCSTTSRHATRRTTSSMPLPRVTGKPCASGPASRRLSKPR